MLNDKELTPYVEAVKKLYVMYRQKFLIQSKLGYVTTKYALHDDKIKEHLQRKQTIGVFAGKYLTGLLAFDIDTGIKSAPKVASDVIRALKGYGFSSNNILVSYSGNKGLHVDLFFDKAIALEKAKTLYSLVLKDTGYSFKDVELRPTHSQGYKLPLSLHRFTGKYCYLMDTDTLERVSDNRILNILPCDTTYFVDVIDFHAEDLETYKDSLVLDKESAGKFEQVIEKTNLVKIKNTADRMNDILHAERLLYPDTRNSTTYYLSMYLKGLGASQEGTESLVANVITNTFNDARDLINSSTTLEYALQEVSRVTAQTYEKDYKLAMYKEPKVRIYKEDIMFVLQPKGLVKQRILLTLLAHSKRFKDSDGMFFMTYQQMSKAGNTCNRGRLSKYIKELEKEGYLDIKSRFIQNKKRLNRSLPNRYTVRSKIVESVNYIEISNTEVKDFPRVITSLLSEPELRAIVTRQAFNEHFKSYYSMN